MDRDKNIEQVGTEGIVFNKMTKSSDKATLLKRARAKYFTNGIVFHLLDLKSELYDSYWNTFHCSNRLMESAYDRKIVTRYCKNRWCMICNRIRTAVDINKYRNILDSWDDKYFVTLTVVNPKADNLESVIIEMGKSFYSCVRSINRKFGKGKFVAIRKLETTYNPYRDDYHPHFHSIVNGKEQASMLLDLWLKKYPTSKREAQDIRAVRNCKKENNDVTGLDDADRTYIELFKYFTKVLSSKYVKSNDSKGMNIIPPEYKRKIYIKALDTIYRAVNGKRTYASYGFTLPKDDNDIFNEDSIKLNQGDDIIVWDWENEVSDWVSLRTGEFLTNYKPTEGLKKIIDDAVK